MMFAKFSFLKTCCVAQLALCAVVGCAMAFGAPQADVTVAPDEIPQVQQISPNQAAPGAQVMVAIQGSKFAVGVYVASVSPAIHVDSSKRISATEIVAQLSISATAQPMTASLLVSNPASRAAEAAFMIVAGAAPSAPPAPPAPPAEIKPSRPATPATPPAPVAPVAPALPAAPATPPGPEVTTIEPARVAPGFEIDLKVTGNNFVKGVKVSFANPGILVKGVTFNSASQLTVFIKVERDAARGATSMYVINGGDQEVEAPFEVTGKVSAPVAPAAPTTPATPPQPGAPPAPGATPVQSYPAFHLGNPTEVFETHGKVKGALVVTADTLQYQEGGKILINIMLKDIKEIKVSTIANATFHITTNYGKTFHFAPTSLRPADARNIADGLRKALPQ